MLGPDQLADVEGDARAFVASYGFDPDERVCLVDLCKEATERDPVYLEIHQEARLEPVGSKDFEVQIREGTAPERGLWLLGHELGELFYRRTAYRGEDIEARCDAFGACLVAPRVPFLKAIRKCGRHAIHDLAWEFRTTQSLALLRVGETTGRPVALLRWPDPIVRGGPFNWASTSRLVRLLSEPIPEVHQVRCDDGWGFMAEEWQAMSA